MVIESIWKEFPTIFKVSKFFVLNRATKELIAEIALTYPKIGEGRLTCYMYLVGSEIQLGIASGCDYEDYTSAIIESAANCVTWCNGFTASQLKFTSLLLTDKAEGGWQEVINESNGFLVIQAV